jgi:hypothetical protein
MMVAMTALQLGYAGGSAFAAARERCKNGVTHINQRGASLAAR